MSGFNFNDKYRLEIKWDLISYDKDEIVKVEGCTLTGPVLVDLDKLNETDSIQLDFISQYIALLPQYYIAVLSWDGVEYKDNSILLKNVFIRNANINSLPNLNNDDYIVVDTSDHENEKHSINVNYTSYLIKADGQRYNFNKG